MTAPQATLAFLLAPILVAVSVGFPSLGSLNQLGAGRLRNPLAVRDLSWKEKGLNQLAVAAHGHSGKRFVPFAFRDLGFSVKPVGEQCELGSGNLALLNPVE